MNDSPAAQLQPEAERLAQRHAGRFEAGVLYGIKPAVTAVVLFAAYRIGSRALRNAVLWTIAAAAFIAIFALHVPFPLIVIAAGIIIGYVGGRIAPTRFQTGKGHASSTVSTLPR